MSKIMSTEPPTNQMKPYQRKEDERCIKSELRPLPYCEISRIHSIWKQLCKGSFSSYSELFSPSVSWWLDKLKKVHGIFSPLIEVNIFDDGCQFSECQPDKSYVILFGHDHDQWSMITRVITMIVISCRLCTTKMAATQDQTTLEKKTSSSNQFRNFKMENKYILSNYFLYFHLIIEWETIFFEMKSETSTLLNRFLKFIQFSIFFVES